MLTYCIQMVVESSVGSGLGVIFQHPDPYLQKEGNSSAAQIEE